MKKKILHILNSSSFSGAEKVVLSIIKNLEDEFDFAYMSLSGEIGKILDEHRVRSFLVSRLSVQQIQRVIKKFQPDMIHAHDFTAGILAAATLTKVPIINHLHNNSPWLQKKGLYSWAYLGTSCRYKQILTVSDAVMDDYVFGNLLKSKCKVVANPVDIESVRKKSGEATLCNPSDVVFFGRLTQAKNPRLFLDIMKLLVEKNDSITGIMIGDGELRSEIEDRIHTLKLDAYVRLYGFQENPFGLIKNTKVVCMPSLWEGFGLTAVESLALGKPVVAARVGGLVNIVDEKCGDFCESAQDYADIIYRYLTSEELLYQKSLGAEKKAEVLDNTHEYMQMMKSVYLRVSDEK